MYKSVFLFLVMATIGSCTSQENKLPVAKPGKVGMSAERLDRIKPVMQSYIDENKLPGMITMVARHGMVVHF